MKLIDNLWSDSIIVNVLMINWLTKFSGGERMEKPNAAVHSFISTNRMHRRTVDKIVSDAGIELHRSQFLLLVHLQHRGDSFSQKELAEHLGISPAALAVKIKRLESDGLILRVKPENDSRVNAVSITDKGKDLLEKTQELFTGVDKRMINGIEEKDLEIFVKCLKTMHKNLEEIYENPQKVKEELE